MAEETTTETVAKESAEKRTPLPKTTADVDAVRHIPTTEATTSFANYMNKHLANADNFTPLTPEQGWAVVGCHRAWQQSEERAAEKEELKKAAAAADEARKEAAEKKKAEKKAEAERKAAEKKRKADEKAAKEAAEADNDSDLDDDAGETVEGEGEIVTAPKKSRARRPRTGASAE